MLCMGPADVNRSMRKLLVEISSVWIAGFYLYKDKLDGYSFLLPETWTPLSVGSIPQFHSFDGQPLIPSKSDLYALATYRLCGNSFPERSTCIIWESFSVSTKVSPQRIQLHVCIGASCLDDDQ